MKWLRNVVVDLLATLIILVWIVRGWAWAGWVVWIYTPLMLLIKAAVLGRGWRLAPLARDDVPAWFYHFAYAVNVVLLVYGAQFNGARWVLAVMWAAIWGLSVLATRRAQAADAEGGR